MGAAPVRALLLAEAANPEWVSVPRVGWCHAEALARHADVHLVTQVRNRDAILRKGWREGTDFTAIDSEAVAAAMWKLSGLLRGGEDRGWTTLTALAWPSYYYFEELVWRQLGERIRAGEWDVVHRITPVSPALPSPIARRLRRARVPFVVGPLNGGVPWPAPFAGLRRREGEWLSSVRGMHRWLPGHAATRRHASAIVVASRTTYRELAPRYRSRCVYIPENAVDAAWSPRSAVREPRAPLRVVFVGRLVPLKCVDVLVEAAAPLCRDGRLRIDVIGDGPERGRLEGLVRRLDVADAVRLLGWVPHEELPVRLREQDAFGFPSVREFGGGAVLEGMAAGLAPVVVDYGGPAELVRDDSGYRVPLGDRDALVRRFRSVLERMASRPREVADKGRRARERASALFTWDAKARQVLRVYEWVLGRASKPDYGMPFR
ncbi:MAG: glycosyltransferase family 4 protein [Myxococcota bacterium]